MTIETVMRVSGFLFWLILVLYPVMAIFGYKIGLRDYDPDVELQKISKHPNKLKISIVLALIDHASIIALAITLFVAFGSYNTALGIIWVILRMGEGLIQVYNEKIYWGLLKTARQYSGAIGTEKHSLSELAHTILKTRDFRFNCTQSLWSIGTLVFSIVLVTYGLVPSFIGWLGIAAGILGGFSNGMELVKRKSRVLKGIGGLSGILFEIIIGGWLLFIHTIP